MYKLVLCIVPAVLLYTSVSAQKIAGRPHFKPGQTILITMDVTNSLTQQAASQAIECSVHGSAVHSYKVITIGPGNTTLHHEMKKLDFRFDGMGQKKTFNSDIKDTTSGKQFREVLSRKYDITIDSTGNTVTTTPERITATNYDDQVVILNDMLKELVAVAYPPQKGTSSFFKVLPAYEVAVHDSWRDSVETEDQKSVTTYTLVEINDTTAIVNFKKITVAKTKSEVMGMEAITHMNYNSVGTVIIDRSTGIVKGKTITIDSNGSTEAMKTSTPMTGKSTITVHVKLQ